MLRQPGSSPFNSDHSDPFDRAASQPGSSDAAGDDHWPELDPFDIEEESQQKTDPDADPSKEEEGEDPALKDC